MRATAFDNHWQLGSQHCCEKEVAGGVERADLKLSSSAFDEFDDDDTVAVDNASS